MTTQLPDRIVAAIRELASNARPAGSTYGEELFRLQEILAKQNEIRELEVRKAEAAYLQMSYRIVELDSKIAALNLELEAERRGGKS